jgi:hypothetical protein
MASRTEAVDSWRSDRPRVRRSRSCGGASNSGGKTCHRIERIAASSAVEAQHQDRLSATRLAAGLVAADIKSTSSAPRSISKTPSTRDCVRKTYQGSDRSRDTFHNRFDLAERDGAPLTGLGHSQAASPSSGNASKKLSAVGPTAVKPSAHLLVTWASMIRNFRRTPQDHRFW